MSSKYLVGPVATKRRLWMSSIAATLLLSIAGSAVPASSSPAPARTVVVHPSACHFPTAIYYPNIKGQTQGWVMLGGADSYLWRGHWCSIGNSMLIMQGDGNLVLYDQYWQPRWGSNTWQPGRQGDFALMQGDGNLVVYDEGSNGVWYPKWASDTCCRGGRNALAVQADGNVVVYDTRWTSDTNQWVPLWWTRR